MLFAVGSSKSSQPDSSSRRRRRKRKREDPSEHIESSNSSVEYERYPSFRNQSLLLRLRRRKHYHEQLSSEEEAEREHYQKRTKIDETSSRSPPAGKWEPNEEYEVEAIRNIRRNPDGTLNVLVKWKNWPDTANSWEPFSNTNCYEAILKFLVTMNDKKYTPLVMHQYVLEKFEDPDANIYIICKLLATDFDLKQTLLLDYREKLRLRGLVRQVDGEKLLYRINKHFGDALEFVRFIDGQQDLRGALLEVQRKVTALIPHEFPVYFENLIDNETLSLDFKFIEDYLYADGIHMRENPASCDCCATVDITACAICRCARTPENGFTPVQNYEIDGGLAERAQKDHSLISECGPKCSCSSDCQNRVTQRGRPVEVTVHKTETKGWGLRANSPIKAWSFVTEYLGMVKRFSKDLCKTQPSHIYELKNDLDESPVFAVDSSKHGNVSRFINHSCKPNLITVRVVNKHAARAIPRLALFACRDIVENEELTLDYRSMKVSPISRSRGFHFKCNCQESDCCGSL